MRSGPSPYSLDWDPGTVFGNLAVLFIEWIPGSPTVPEGYLEIRFSRMDSWNQKLDIWRYGFLASLP
jgi:hypothetical protein